jgi:hypothetical protein
MREHSNVSETEFTGANVGDKRLNRRLQMIVAKLEQQPDASFPTAMTRAELEAFYRFMSNDRVTMDDILAPHVTATAARCAQAETVLAISDTTTLQFPTPREGLGPYAGRTLFAHAGLMQDLNGRPLGVLAVEPWVRADETASSLKKKHKVKQSIVSKMPNEQDRWLRLVRVIDERAGADVNVVHVMDSEADDYDIMQQMKSEGRRFVIRGGIDRRLQPVEGCSKARELMATRDVLATRTAKLAKRVTPRLTGTTHATRRRQLARDERTARLAITAAPVNVRRPGYLDPKLPPYVELNIVCAREVDAPEGADPVEWLLLTTEPIDTVEQVLAVVDMYRHRWRVEELFKALKTGCAFQKRQLDSYRTIVKALALFLPIAWSLLHMRTVSRAAKNVPAACVLTAVELEVLRKASEKPLRRKPSINEAMLAIARLGGHLPSNGPPGWQVLGRGYFKLLDLVRGYLLATRCDQS